MKSKFPQFLIRSPADKIALWNDATFVFDSSVLLNVYRYSSSAQNDFFEVLRSLGDRVWISYHTALEFHRNKFSVIANQIKIYNDYRVKLSEAKDNCVAGVQKFHDSISQQNRYFTIEPASFLKEIEKTFDNFIEKFEELGGRLQKPNEHDALLDKIDSIFEGKIGEAPTKEEIECWQKDAETRFKYKIPPGYADDAKDKDGPDEYMHNSIIYKRKYGDYINWSEILKFAADGKIKSLIYVTDDAKEDWWLKVKADASKKLGPRIELIEDAKVKGGIDNFWMYSPSQFLDFAKEKLKNVSQETINEVKEVSRASTTDVSTYREYKSFVNGNIFRRLQQRFDQVTESPHGGSFYCMSNAIRQVYKVCFLVDNPTAYQAIGELLAMADREMKDSYLNAMTMGFVVKDTSSAKQLMDKLANLQGYTLSGRQYISIVICDPEKIDEQGVMFYDEVNFNQINIFTRDMSRNTP